MRKLSLTLVVGAALAAPAFAQFTLVGPAICTTVEGNSNNIFPWGRTTDQRYQQIFDSTTFSGQTVSYPVLINNLRFRADNATASWPGGMWSGPIQIMLSTSPVDYLAFSTTFASNQGANLTTVYNGPVTKLPGTSNGAGLPSQWFIDIPLTTPFLYDPNQGDLTLDVLMAATVFTGTVTTAGDAESSANAFCSRLWADGTTATVALGSAANYGIVTEFGYVPAAGLYASFSSNVTGGALPLTVNFTDTSYTSGPGAVTSWAWDLNGDSVIDSTLQNPSFTYAVCGAYNVSLTVTDASHPPSTLTRTGYIQAGILPIAPSFTFASLAPGVFQFTDTSTPTPASWAWDLNGDMVTDSTAQNPVWAYPAPCTAVSVTLSVSSTCAGPWSTSRSIVLSPLSMTTLLTGGNGLTAVGSGNTFDINVTNPKGITICALTMAPYGGAINVPLGCTVWVTDAAGGYLANHTNAAVWRQVSTGTGTHAGGTFNAVVPVAMALTKSIYLPQGLYGMAVHMTTGSGVAYTTLTAQTTYPGPDFSIIAGNGKGAPFNATANNPRAWNGTIHYSTFGNGDQAGYGFFGSGCAGTMPVSNLTHNAPPVLGTTMSVSLNNLPNSVALMMTGFSKTTSILGPLPLAGAPYGAPGCNLRVSPDANLLLIGAANAATWNLTVPVSAGFIGVLLYNQAIVFNPGFNGAGAVISDAHGMMIGQ